MVLRPEGDSDSDPEAAGDAAIVDQADGSLWLLLAGGATAAVKDFIQSTTAPLSAACQTGFYIFNFIMQEVRSASSWC